MCLNARSLINKIDKLEEIIILYSPDIVIITETWLHAQIHDTEISPASYSLIRTDRDSRGGGVAIMIKSSLTFQEEPGIANHESAWCTIQFDNTSLLIGAIYRHPGAHEEYLLKVHDYLHSKINNRTKLLLTGDFNLAGIDWNKLTIGNRDAKNCEHLFDIMFSFSLSQIVNEPTRVQGNACSVLDLALVSQSITPHLRVEEGISDHKMLVLTFFTLRMSAGCKTKPSRIAFKDYSRANDESVIDYLEETLDGFSAESCGGVNGLWIKLKEAIMHCENNFIPTKFKRTERKTPWITRSIIHLKRKLRRRRRKRINSAEIIELACKLKLEIKAAKDDFFSNKLTNFIRNQPQSFGATCRSQKA